MTAMSCRSFKSTNFAIFVFLLAVILVAYLFGSTAMAKTTTDIQFPPSTSVSDKIDRAERVAAAHAPPNLITKKQSESKLASNPPPKNQSAKQNLTEETQQAARARPKGQLEVQLSLITLSLGAFMVIMLCIMGWFEKLSDAFVRSFIVTLIVFSALYLIVAGYDEKQTAPVFGILGTVLGYIFGRGERNSKPDNPQTANIKPNSDSQVPVSPAPAPDPVPSPPT